MSAAAVTTQTFETKGVVRAAYVQFFWYTEEAGDGNYLHPVPVQALCGASGVSASCVFVVLLRERLCFSHPSHANL